MLESSTASPSLCKQTKGGRNAPGVRSQCTPCAWSSWRRLISGASRRSGNPDVEPCESPTSSGTTGSTGGARRASVDSAGRAFSRSLPSTAKRSSPSAARGANRRITTR